MIDTYSVTTMSKELFESFFVPTFDESWKTWELEEQKTFKNLIEQYYAAACIIREKFDADVWKGHANGTVDPSVDSIRKQREGDKPGKKAEPVTAESLLKKRLAK